MTKQELKAKIDKLENGIKSKATPSNLIAPLKAQKAKFEKELEQMESAEKKAVKTKKVSKVAEKIKAAKTSVAKKTPAKAPAKEERKKDNIARDGDRKSLPAGKRISKSGNVYYETRANRSDKQTSKKPYLAKGGNLKLYDKENSYRLARPSGYIEKDILRKVTFNEDDFVGNFGWKTSEGKLADGYLFKLNEYDQNLVKDIKLKEGEKIYRYFNRTSAIGGMKPLIKISTDKELLYFLAESENDEIVFETKGVQAQWIALIEDKMAKGGTLNNPKFLEYYQTLERWAHYRLTIEKGKDYYLPTDSTIEKILANDIMYNDGKVDKSTHDKMNTFLVQQLKDLKMNAYPEYADGGETDGYSYGRLKGFESQDWEKMGREYAGSEWDNLSKNEKDEIITDLQKDWNRNTSFAKGGDLSEAIYLEGTGWVMPKTINKLNEDGVSEPTMSYEPIESMNKKNNELKNKDMNYAKGGDVKKHKVVTSKESYANDLLKYADLQNIPASSKMLGNKFIVTFDAIPKAMDSMTQDVKNLVNKMDKGGYMADGGMMAKGGELSVFAKNQIKIAKDTLKMSNEGASLMGGMTKDEAKKILEKYKIKMADGGYMAYGGKTKTMKSIKDLTIEQISSMTGVGKSGVERFSDENNLTESDLSNVMQGLGRRMISASNFATAVSGEKNNQYTKEIVDFAKSGKGYKMADGGMFEAPITKYWNTIKDFYINTYPTDDLGQEINAGATFDGLNRVLDCNIDVYEYIGVGDSIVRERLFEKLAELEGVNYDVIYNKWLASDFEKGGYMAKGGELEKYIVEKDKDGSYKILNTEKGMYIDQTFETKSSAESWKKEKDLQRERFGMESYFAKGGKVPAHFGSGKNINVFGYQTENFDICATAVKEFESAIQIMDNGKEVYKESLAKCAKYIDSLFGIEKYVVENEDADDANFYEAISSIMSASIYNYRAEMSINLFSFVPQHLKEIAVRMGKAEKGGFYALGGMTAGRWYKDKSGEEFKFIGKVDSGANKGRFLFSDGQKSVYKELEDFEGGKPKETKLFGFFEEGGMLIHGFQQGDTILEIYKGYGIVENKNNGVIEVLNPNRGTRFIIDLDESKPTGRKSMGMSKDEQMESAKRYIDYLDKPLPDTLLEKFRAEGKMEKGGYMADGGSIPNNYEGKKPNQIWGALTKKQRSHFLNDHKLEIEMYIKSNSQGQREKLSTDEIIEAYNTENYFDLDNNIRSVFDEHISEGQYAYGGYMADGGMMDVVNAEISTIKRNIMGTTSFVMKIKGMRNPQDFIVYPISADQAGQPIMIQSDTRIGFLDLSSGRGLMSQSHANGAYRHHFTMDKKVPFKISETDLQRLKEHISGTAGSSVGNMGISSDNSGASMMAKGGGVEKFNKGDKFYDTQEQRLVEIKNVRKDGVIEFHSITEDNDFFFTEPLIKKVLNSGKWYKIKDELGMGLKADGGMMADGGELGLEPQVGDVADFGEGLEKITRIFTTPKGKQYIEAIQIDGSSDRRNLYDIEDWSSILQKQEEYKKSTSERESYAAESEKLRKLASDLETEKLSKYNDIDGFGENLTPMQKARVLKYLNKKTFTKDGGEYKLSDVKTELKEVFKRDWYIRPRNGEDTIMYKEGNNDFILGDVFQTKTSREYLEYLKSNKKMAKGGELEFKNSNLYLNGFGMDSNGNSVVKVSFPNQRAFSIQTNGVLNETNSLYTKKIGELTEAEIKTIEKEVVEYVKQFGSKEQKQRLKTYSGYMADGGEASIKNFNTMMNVGKAKYVINHHDGKKTHKDGSPFYDLATFKNMKDFIAYKKKLKSEGYKEYKDGGMMAKGGKISEQPKFILLQELEDKARSSSYKAKNYEKWNETIGNNYRNRWNKMILKLRGWNDSDGSESLANTKKEWIDYTKERGLVWDYNFADVLA